MKFVADENLGIQVPNFLKTSGFDIISITEIAPGNTDIEVLNIANTENRILITLTRCVINSGNQAYTFFPIYNI